MVQAMKWLTEWITTQKMNQGLFRFDDAPLHNFDLESSPLMLTSPTLPPIIIEPCDSEIISLPHPSYQYSPELQQFLCDKRYPVNELPFSIDLLYEHYKHGYVQFERAIEIKGHHIFCKRCGNQDPEGFAVYPCSRCGKLCPYCRKCIMMGAMKACTPLIHWTGPPILHPFTSQEKLLPHPPELTPYQVQASEKVKQAMLEKKELLIWAVCGAGKTEVLFSGLALALARGENVALATPRTDVVLELMPRLQAAFPDVKVVALYGSSPDRFRRGQLVITTTHQLLRYYRAFDVVVIDEIDAFPFSVDPMLRYAMEQAKKEKSSQILLTATPDPKLKQLFYRNKLDGIQIPRRFHGFPLPLPEFHWMGNWTKGLHRGQLPARFVDWLKAQRETGHPLLIFVSSIPILQLVSSLVMKIDPLTESVHAADPNRTTKVQAFRKGELHILVTTTILERGITIPMLDVTVFGAEAPIFNESALVQIAGRVGRSADHPSGAVVFFHYGRTEAMLQSRRHIEKMNRQAFG